MMTLSFTIDEPLLRALDRCVKEASTGGRSEAVRQAIRDWLKKQALRKRIEKELQGYRKQPVRKEEFGALLSAQEWPK